MPSGEPASDVVGHLRDQSRRDLEWHRLHRKQTWELLEYIDELEWKVRQCEKETHVLRQHLRVCGMFLRKMKAEAGEKLAKKMEDFLKTRWMRPFRDYLGI